MGAAGTIARRTFLVGSAAIAGGVAFGTYTVKKPHANPLLEGQEEGEAVFNPWVKIDAEKVTLITPHADLGQGVVSMQAALIAEEMDLEWGQFETDLGVPSPAYYNTALADEAAPFLARDLGFQAETMRGVMGTMFKLMGLQGTGGSTSVPDSFNKLRVAGAVARETLKKAAAKRSKIAVKKLRTEGGAVLLPDGTAIPYTDLALEASKIRPVKDAQLRAPDQWKLIGKPMQRLDIVAKSTGTQSYGIDLVMEGMVHAAIRTNPRQGGFLNGFDATKAKKMRGVQAVVEVEGGVAAIADNSWRAFKAVEAVQCDWGEAPYPAEQEDHWREVENSFTSERLEQVWRDDGKMEQALQDGSPIEAGYKAPYLAHAPLEPLNAIVLVTDERVDIWAAHQMPIFTLIQVGKVTGHKREDIFLHNQYAGGSFGHRLEFENIERAAEIANKMRDTPVKLTYSREEDFLHDFPRQIAMARGRGLVENGKVTAYDMDIAAVSSSASQFSRIDFPSPPPDKQLAVAAWNLPYDFEHYRMSAYRVPELAPTSSWRSVGASSNGFFADCFIDELIHAAGADPMAERLRLCNWEVARGVLEAVAEMSNWGSVLGPNQGRGVAYVESFGVPVAEVVEVTHTKNGIQIDKVFVAADVGKVVDPINFDNHVKGGVVFGLGHAMNCEITYADGMAQQTNYHAFEAMRLYQCPEIHVRGLENNPKIRGIGEPPVPPAAPALANAIFAATGQRIREMPFNKHIDFV